MPMYRDGLICMMQKTHSASIIAGPNAYEADDKRPAKKVIDLDCRGLEFTEFKPDVTIQLHMSYKSTANETRASGKPKESSLALHLRALISSRRKSGMIMMKRLARRFPSRMLSGRLRGDRFRYL